MILVVCVDDRMGMMFHHRRISQDKRVCDNILNMCQDKCLYMDEYSYKLFQDYMTDIIRVIDNISAILIDDCYYFAERSDAIQEKQVKKIVLYRWNRRYPADQYFPIDLKKWSLVSREEFTGNSHEKITKEIWVR